MLPQQLLKFAARVAPLCRGAPCNDLPPRDSDHRVRTLSSNARRAILPAVTFPR